MTHGETSDDDLYAHDYNVSVLRLTSIIVTRTYNNTLWESKQ